MPVGIRQLNCAAPCLAISANCCRVAKPSDVCPLALDSLGRHARSLRTAAVRIPTRQNRLAHDSGHTVAPVRRHLAPVIVALRAPGSFCDDLLNANRRKIRPTRCACRFLSQGRQLVQCVLGGLANRLPGGRGLMPWWVRAFKRFGLQPRKNDLSLMLVVCSGGFSPRGLWRTWFGIVEYRLRQLLLAHRVIELVSMCRADAQSSLELALGIALCPSCTRSRFEP